MYTSACVPGCLAFLESEHREKQPQILHYVQDDSLGEKRLQLSNGQFGFGPAPGALPRRNRSSTGLRPVNPDSTVCQCSIEGSPMRQHSSTTSSSSLNGKSSSPESRSFTCTPIESISAIDSRTRSRWDSISARSLATLARSTRMPPER